MNEDTQMRERVAALELIAAAIHICDAIGEAVAACHLQFGADLLQSGLEDSVPHMPARSLQ